MQLTDMKCRNVKPGPNLRKISDGGGLQLWVQPSGARQWRVAYRFDGKQKLLAVGAYPTVSLANARHARDEAKKLLASGIDPSQAKKQAKIELQANADTFQVLAEEYIEKIAKEGRAERTLAKVKWLLSFAYPIIGSTNIKAIRPRDVLEVLRKVEGRELYESARRLRSTIGSVFRYAIATDRAELDPTIALQGALISPTVTPRAAIVVPKPLGGLLRAIDAFEGHSGTKEALQLMALLFPRPGELRAAEWPEFDFESAVWTVPAGRMKMRRPHRSPLPKQAIVILKKLQAIVGKTGLLFPGARDPSRPISDNTMNAALRRLGYGKDEATSQGFRATASTLLNESGKWHPDAIERQLAHVEGNDVRRAYARGDHWDERVQMMQWWADYLDTLKKGARK